MLNSAKTATHTKPGTLEQCGGHATPLHEESHFFVGNKVARQPENYGWQLKSSLFYIHVHYTEITLVSIPYLIFMLQPRLI